MKIKINAIKLCCLAVCILSFICAPGTYKADGEEVRIDCDGGTFRIFEWANAYDQGYVVKIGASLSDYNHVLENPTDIGRDFIGWNIYKQSDGTLLESMLTTQQVKDYKIPCPILVKAQYTNRPGAPVKGITYAAINNETGEPVWDAKVTIIYDGVSYSGNGYVCISEELYSKWKGTLTYILEAPGWYAMQNGKWTDVSRDVSELSISSFKRHRSSYNLLTTTGKGKEIEHPRAKINDIFYEASLVKPNISKTEVVGANTMISDTTVIPANATIEKAIYESGKIYDTALASAQSQFNTGNVLVLDLNLKDANGALIHQLAESVQVKLDIPSDYVIQSGNTVIVYYLEDDGTLTECATAYHEENGSRYVLFETNHFSPYVMVEVPEKVEEPEDTQPEETTEETETTEVTEPTESKDNTESGDNTEVGGDTDNDDSGSMLPIIIAALAFVVIIVAGILFMKKK